MEGKLKIALQVAFLAVLIWMLASLAGYAQGATLQIGKGRGKRCGNGRRYGASWPGSGMVGELIPSPGTDVPTVGRPTPLF